MKLLSEVTVLKPLDLCPEPPSRGILHFPVVNKKNMAVLLEWEDLRYKDSGLHGDLCLNHINGMVASKSHRYLVTLSTHL